jgi:hypothetical protein
MSWSEMFIDKGEVQSTEGIISRDAPVNSAQRSGVQIRSTNVITQKHTILTLLEAKSNSQNNVALLDCTLLTIARDYVFEAVETSSERVIGFILSIQHSLRLQSFKSKTSESSTTKASKSSSRNTTNETIISTGLTTHLTIDPKYRKDALAMDLIRAVISKGYTNSIYCGYHFTKEAHSKSSIRLTSWYRILDVQKAYSFGYRATANTRNIDMALLEQRHKPNTVSVEWSIRPTEYADFDVLERCTRKLRINKPDANEWARLSATPLRWFTLVESSQVVGLAAIRPFIVYLADTKKICTASQLAFFDAVNLKAGKQLGNLLFGALIEGGYTVLHGVSMGTICNLEDYLKIIRSGHLWLDFYNLRLESTRAEDISVLYV